MADVHRPTLMAHARRDRALRTIDAVWRMESAKLIASLARMLRDVGLAEELAQDALVCALEQWPQSGVPDNPGAWLMTTAKHRAIDRLRRHQLQQRKHEELGYEIELHQELARGCHPRCARRSDRRRPAAAGVHRLPSGAVAGGARRADAAPAWRPDYGRDRARLPGARAHHRPAHRPRQAHAGRGAGAVRGAARRGTGRAAVGGACPSST